MPYRGYGTAELLHLQGRVLRGPPIPPARAEDRVWRNLLHTLRRIESDAVPHAAVRAHLEGRSYETLADDEGFFRFDIRPAAPLDAARLWHDVAVDLVDPPAETGAVGKVLVPPESAEFALISDIDDTVIRTDATNLLRMARMVLLTNAHTRLPFEGVAAFYRALYHGAAGAARNPVFYVSSSPWNLYGLLAEVFEVHELPAGPLFLKDYDLRREMIFAKRHHTHKLAAIRALFDTYNLPFVLVGDSGQQDPEIYREVVREYPGRVRAIYIRDVSPASRDEGVHAVAAEVRELGVEMLLVRDTVTAAEHAAARGLIRPDALDAIRTGKAQDETAPKPLETLVDGTA